MCFDFFFFPFLSLWGMLVTLSGRKSCAWGRGNNGFAAAGPHLGW